jgi:hypothetical protein
MKTLTQFEIKTSPFNDPRVHNNLLLDTTHTILEYTTNPSYSYLTRKEVRNCIANKTSVHSFLCLSIKFNIPIGKKQ